MEEYRNYSIKYVVISLLIGTIILILFLMPTIPTVAQNQQSSWISASIAGPTVNSVGLGQANQGQTSAQPAPGFFPFSSLLKSSNNLSGDPVLTILNVEGSPHVYRIINGLKHAIPNQEIFFSYGYNLKMIQNVTAQELAKYPTARLFMVQESDEAKDQTVYYLTDGGMLRPILNDKVFYSYGDRKEDVVVINQKEFNFYPRNQYIFVERPKLNREVYQITRGIKRYLTPVAVQRLNLKESDIVPVNQIEFDEYPEGEPVIF